MADPTQLEFINKQEQAYFAEAVLGEEVRQFLVSSVGKLLHGRAKLRYEECRNEMFELDPYTAEGKRKFLALKQEAWAASHFLEWIAEAILYGNNAEALLMQMREGE